jgi:hypothetical protein
MLRLKKCGPTLIVFGASVMTHSIELHNQLLQVAIEVGDVPPDWMLPTESKAGKLSPSQATPEQSLGEGCVATKTASAPRDFRKLAAVVIRHGRAKRLRRL